MLKRLWYFSFRTCENSYYVYKIAFFMRLPGLRYKTEDIIINC